MGLQSKAATLIPERESRRLAALDSYGILDTPSEASFDELTELVARLFNSPVAYIKFIDRTRGWFKSKIGFLPEVTEVPREATICTTTINQSDLVVIPDLAADERFADNPTVTGPPHLRFYCGMPLIDGDGNALGTFCVVDFEPRQATFEQQELLRVLAHQVVSQLELRRASSSLAASVAELNETREAVGREKERVDALLYNILPRQVADELKETGRVRPRHHALVSIMFADFAAFSGHVVELSPADLVQTLDRYFGVFDDIVDLFGLEKIKTIGDCYMCAGGVPAENRTHVVDACLAALQIQTVTEDLNAERAKLRLAPWRLRIGLHAGPVMTGVVGRRKFTYDVWGDTVNIAQRLEAVGETGRINVSEAVCRRVAHLFELSPGGRLTAAGRQMPTFFLDRIRPAYAEDAAGTCPNDRFRQERHRLPLSSEIDPLLTASEASL